MQRQDTGGTQIEGDSVLGRYMERNIALLSIAKRRNLTPGSANLLQITSKISQIISVQTEGIRQD
jgi:hypothetical protein